MRIKLDIQRFAEDGEIIIGTKVDNSGLKKDLNKTNQILNNFEKEGLNFKDIDITNSDDINDLKQAMEIIKEIKAEEIELIPNIDLKNLEYQKLEIIDELTNIMTEMDNAMNLNPDMDFKDIMQYLKKLNEVSKKLDEIDLKEEEIGKGGFAGVNLNIERASNNITGVIKKIGRWTLSLLGVQSILSLITSSMSVLSNYNTELSNKLQSIKLALASALEPLVKSLIHWIEILLSYLNVITKIFFGIDIFARGAELSTSKMADNMGSAAGSAKEIRKQLAGFDEMNVLGDNVGASGGGGGGAGGLNADDFKFNLEEQPVAKWFKDAVKWVKENYKWLLLIAGVITLISGLIKGLGLVSKLSSAAGALGGLSTAAEILLGALARVGIEIGSIYLYAKSMESAADNTSGSVSGLAKSFGLLYGAVVLMSSINPLVAILEELTGGVYILNQYMNNSEAIVTNLDRAELNLADAQKQHLDAVNKLKDAQNEYNSTIDSYESATKRATDAQAELDRVQQETGMSGEALFNQVKNGELTYLNMTDTQKEVYKAYMNNVDAQEQLNEKTADLIFNESELIKANENEKKSAERQEKAKRDLSLATQLASGDYEGFKKSVIDSMDGTEKSTKRAKDYLSQAMAGMSDASRKTFTKDLPKDLKEGLDPSKYETKAQKLQTWFSKLSDNIGGLFHKLGGGIGDAIWGGIKGVLNSAMGVIEGLLNVVVRVINTAIPVLNKLPGVSIERLRAFSLPRLATGAIINQPGKGVPIGNAIAGEAGREGILPLTDRNAMEMLGKEIGKWITLNANIPVSIGNRQIAREVRQLMAQDDFAMNN